MLLVGHNNNNDNNNNNNNNNARLEGLEADAELLVGHLLRLHLRLKLLPQPLLQPCRAIP